MDFSVEAAGVLGRRLRIRVAAEDVRRQVEQRLRKLSRNVRLDGFRPGKAPFHVVEQRFGREVFNEVAYDLMQSHYDEVLREESLKPAGPPKFEDVQARPGEALEFTADVEIYPEFEVAEMNDAAIERPHAEVSEADVDDMVQRVRKNLAGWKPVARAARRGDRLVVDVKRRDADANAPGGANDVTLVLGEGRALGGVDEQLEGARAGDVRSVRAADGAPAAADDARGNVYEVAVKSVEEAVLPELDEAFFKTCGVKEGGLDGLRAMLREGMEKELRKRLAATLKRRVMDALLEQNTFDVPAVMVAREIESLRHAALRRFQMEEGDEQRLPDELFHDDALRRVRLGLLLHRYAERHGIRADRAAFEAKLDELTAAYEDPAAAKNYYRGNERMRMSVEALAVEDGVVADVLEKARVERKTYSFKEIVRADAGLEQTYDAT